ncbi:MAG TPA: 30S ribosomal protein S13 [Candidatus Nanoarchaeia archaeon]|nr:30S ribosomal protein S13 [Candidatus Nanoarchaeia archaeon]
MAENIKHFVRIRNTDLLGSKQILMALQKIHGVGFNFANAICYATKIPPTKITGTLSDEEIQRLEKLILNYDSIPKWLFNRRKDVEEGIDKHITSADLKLTKETDIKKMRRIRSYKGIRHSLNQPVRGQRTKAHFRKGKAVGVAKSKKGTK